MEWKPNRPTLCNQPVSSFLVSFWAIATSPFSAKWRPASSGEYSGWSIPPPAKTPRRCRWEKRSKPATVWKVFDTQRPIHWFLLFSLASCGNQQRFGSHSPRTESTFRCFSSAPCGRCEGKRESGWLKPLKRLGLSPIVSRQKMVNLQKDLEVLSNFIGLKAIAARDFPFSQPKKTNKETQPTLRSLQTQGSIDSVVHQPAEAQPATLPAKAWAFGSHWLPKKKAPKGWKHGRKGLFLVEKNAKCWKWFCNMESKPK